MSKLTPMLQQYFAIKEQHKDAVLFFHLGDFYEMFGDDAVQTSRILDLTLTCRNRGTANEIPMCGVPLKAASGYIAKLTKAGKKIAICEQVSDPDGQGIVQREVTRIITPGTTFDETVLSQKHSNYLAAVTEFQDQFGLGIVDATTGQFKVGQFSDKQQLLEEIFRVNPSEILAVNVDERFVDDFPHDIYLQKFELPAWRQPAKILTEHFKIKGLQGYGLENNQLLQNLAASLIAYLQETQKSTLAHIRRINIMQYGQEMMLDESTIRNLEIFNNQQTGREVGSLIDVIDRTRTSMGGRLLRWWLSHPLLEKNLIEHRLQAVSIFVDQPTLQRDMGDQLKSLCDIERLVGKVGVQRINPRDVYNLKETLKLIPQIKQLLHAKLSDSSLLDRVFNDIDEHESVVAEIERVIVEDPPVQMQDGGYIAKEVDKELDLLREISTSGKQWISSMQQKERDRTGISSLKVKFNKVFGYYLEVSKSNLSAVPDDYIRKQTLVNAERFVTPELKEYEEKVLGAQDKILSLEQKIFSELRKFLLEQVNDLQKTAQAIAELDVICCFAELALTNNYCRPEIAEDDIISIQQGRHPVIEKIQEDPYIPNDTQISGQTRFLLLTGPNMSGKSSYLRQVALIVLLAQVGCFVPARSMKWTVVDRIFTRVGASDNLAHGRSTFMVEMQEAAYILNNASSQSLIILDELGRGTSTYDGLSLAWAITEYLHDVVKAKTLFATHYHELIEVVDKLPAAQNYSVAVAEKEDGVVFLHQILEGGINRSYGIEVGKLAGLPNHLILRAKDLLIRLEKHAWENNGSEKQPSLPLMPVKQMKHPVIEKLEEVEPNHLTPMQALALLIKLKEELE